MPELKLEMEVTFDEVLMNCLDDGGGKGKIVNEIKAKQIEQILAWLIPMMNNGVSIPTKTLVDLLDGELIWLRS